MNQCDACNRPLPEGSRCPSCIDVSRKEGGEATVIVLVSSALGAAIGWFLGSREWW